MAKQITPAQRRRRILLDGVLLLAVLFLAALQLGFPTLTAEQAMRIQQRRSLFGPGEVIAQFDTDASQGQFDRYYILRRGDWYAWCGVRRSGPFWYPGGLGAVENDPALPLTALPMTTWSSGAILVVSNDPDITAVEAAFPADTPDGPLCTVRGERPVEGCFILRYEDAGFPDLTAIRLRGYDAAGELLYESVSRSTP